MPTQNPRAMITFNDKDLYEQVQTYRYEHRFRSQNDAVMDLISRGIEVILGETLAKPKIELNGEEKRIVIAYRSADPVYQSVALELLENHPAMKKESHA